MTNEQRVRDFWRRVWVEGDVGHAHDFFAPRYRQNDFDRTPDRLAAVATQTREDFGDLQVEVVRLFALQDVVVSRVIYRGEHRRDWPGIPAAGARVEFSGLDAFRFEDGLVVEHLHEADHEALWEQLGVRLPPG